MSARLLSCALLLLGGCYLSHGRGDAPAPRDAGADARPEVDAGAPPPPVPRCEVRAAACEPLAAPFRFRVPGAAIGFHDVAWTGRLVVVAYDWRTEDGREGSEIGAVTPAAELVAQTSVESIDWPDLAWHPGEGRGVAVGADRVIWISDDGLPLGERAVRPFDLGAHAATVAPVPSGFLVFVAPMSGGALREFYGASIGTRPVDLDWQTLGEEHVTNMVVPALDEDGYAGAITTGYFSPQRRVHMAIEDGVPGAVLFEDRIGSSAGEDEALLLAEGATYAFNRSRAGGVFEEISGGAIVETHFVDGDALGAGPTPFASGIDGDALVLGPDIIFAAESSDGGLGLASWTPASGEASLELRDAGTENRPNPRLARTSRGFVVAWGCDADLCVDVFDCCVD